MHPFNKVENNYQKGGVYLCKNGPLLPFYFDVLIQKMKIVNDRFRTAHLSNCATITAHELYLPV